jgi:hypothetical protein
VPSSDMTFIQNSIKISHIVQNFQRTHTFSSYSSERFRVRPGELIPNTQDGLGRSIVVWVVCGLVLVVDTLMLVVVIFLCPFSEGVFFQSF